MTDDRSTDDVRSPAHRARGADTNEPARDERKAHETAFMEEYGYRLLSALTVLLLTVGTVAYHLMEDWSWVDSFYFSAVAVTTVGFGDLTPSSDVSKLFTVVYIFSGIAIITAFLNLRLRRRTTTIARERRSHRHHGDGTPHDPEPGVRAEEGGT